MRETITTCGELVGSAVASIGFGMVNPALGLIVAGALVTVFSWLASR